MFFLCVSPGDQVVSVNGETVGCKSYVQVVQMIQKSGPTLELVVMPKEHDVLQQVRGSSSSPHSPMPRDVDGVKYPPGRAPLRLRPLVTQTC